MSEKSKKGRKHRKSKPDSDSKAPPHNAPPIPGVAPSEEPQVGDELPPHDEHSRKYDREDTSESSSSTKRGS